MGVGGIVQVVGGFAKKALDTEGQAGDGSGSKDKDSVLGKIGKLLKGSGKTYSSSDAGDAGAGDLGQMGDGTATAKKGGKVKKTGFIKLHKGEKVIRKKMANKKGPRKRA